MDIPLLATKLQEPQYELMDNAAAAAALNIEDIEIDVDFIEPYEVFESIIVADYNSLTADKKQLLQMMLNMGPIKVKGANTRLAFQNIFNGTTTLTNLVSLQTKLVSWANQNWVGPVKEGHVEMARAM
jgi:hypothetical protein